MWNVQSRQIHWNRNDTNGRQGLEEGRMEDDYQLCLRFPLGVNIMFWNSLTEKEDWQDCLLSSCLFNLYAEHIMRNVGLDELQAGIKISGRNINNLRYADDIILMTESEVELKTFLMTVKEESEIASLKLNIKKRRSWHPASFI